MTAAGISAAVGIAGAMSAVETVSAAIDVSARDDYDVWTVTGQEVYDLSDGEELSNVLIDQTAEGACLTIRSRNKTGWTVRNVGFLGVGQAGSGGNRFQFQVSTPAGGDGLIENVWANGKARNGQPATELGGIFLRSSHAGHIDVRHTYIEGFGNNAVYGSSVGKDGGNDGSVAIENCYHRDNTASQFRIGSPGSSVRNSVGVIDDPDGDRGPYPGSGDNRNARGVWGKHYRNQRFENCSFYLSPDDANPDGVFEARYIQDRSHGEEAVTEVVECDVNADAPTLSGSTSNASVAFTQLGEQPTVTVLQNGGVPLSPEMAARGDRSMPPELPGAEGGDSTPTLERTLSIDGSGAGWTDYSVTVSGEIADNEAVGSLGDGDAIDGSTASGFVNGGVDGYRFSGEIDDLTVAGDAAILVDGQQIDPSAYGDPDPTVSTGTAGEITRTAATVSGTLESLGEADSATVGFEWRQTGSSGWTETTAETLSSPGQVTLDLTELTADTAYEYRAVVTASDGDAVTGSVATFSTDAAPRLERTLSIDGSDAGWTNYSVTVSGEIANNEAVGSLGDGDAIDGSSASGFVNGGVDGYRFSGEIDDLTVAGDAAILVDGQQIDPSTYADPDPTISTGSPEDVSRTAATVTGTLESLGEADSATVGFEWRQTGSSGWTEITAETLSSSGQVTLDLTELAADTAYEYRAVVTASDGDAVTGSVATFSTDAAPRLERTLSIDGSDAGRTDYSVTVSGEIAGNDAVGSLGDGDTIDGSTASGFVNGGVDGYRFSGEIVDATVAGDAAVIVDGQSVEPESLPIPNQVVFDADGTSTETTYEVQVSGDLANDPRLGSLEQGDSIDGRTVTGSVTGQDRDGYRFSGDLLGLRLDGQAKVRFEDTDG